MILFFCKLGSFSSRAGSSWLVIANELKSWLASARYHNEPSRVITSRGEPSRASHEPSELTSFEFFVQPPSSQIVGSGLRDVYPQRMHSNFFEKKLQIMPSNSLFQTARGSGATLSKCSFSEKCTPLEDFKKHYMVSLRKHSDKPCFYLARPGVTRRLPRSTIQCAGACGT